MNSPGIPFSDPGFNQNRNLDNKKIILNTRVKLSRNLRGHKFLTTSSNADREDIVKLIKNLTSRLEKFKDFRFFLIKDLDKLQRKSVVKEYILDPVLIDRPAQKAILINEYPSYTDVSLSVIINHQDHLQIQCTLPGFNMDEAFRKADQLEKEFEKHLDFAFDQELGYLTSSPTSLGTALRTSVMAHLPALALSSDFADFVKKLNQTGYTFAGYFNENIEVVGNLFIISSGKTLGASEEDIIEEMKAICLNIIESERKARLKLMKNDPIGLKDNISRSYGLVKYAKILSYDEALELLSVIRLGIDEEFIKNLNNFDLFKMINIISDTNIIISNEIDEKISEDDIDMIRARLLRKLIFKRN